jgi:hypothetical protein
MELTTQAARNSAGLNRKKIVKEAKEAVEPTRKRESQSGKVFQEEILSVSILSEIKKR